MSVLKKSKFRTIYIMGEINEQSFAQFHADCQAALDNQLGLNLVIHSEGGLSLTALAYYDLIKSYPFRTRCMVHGHAQSAATLIFAACRERFMGKSAWLMFHEDQHGDLPDMSTTGIEVLAARARRFEQQWLQLMHESTGMSMAMLDSLHTRETWLNYEQCSALGLLSETKV